MNTDEEFVERAFVWANRGASWGSYDTCVF